MNTPMNAVLRERLQNNLVAAFTVYGCNVAVGLTKTGVAIRSQDQRVDARNVDVIKAERIEQQCCELAQWLVTLDALDSQERHTITVTGIIQRAREALGDE